MGTVIGMLLIQAIAKKITRQSALVVVLGTIFLISVVAVPYFGLREVL